MCEISEKIYREGMEKGVLNVNALLECHDLALSC